MSPDFLLWRHARNRTNKETRHAHKHAGSELPRQHFERQSLDSKRINIAIWTVQILLAALFLFAGGFKLVAPIAEMTKQIVLPGLFLRFLGVVEIAGALGLILPSLLRIRPYLTPLAAGGLVIIMSGATGISLTGGKIERALVPFVVGLLAGLVLYARTRVVPIGEKGARIGAQDAERGDAGSSHGVARVAQRVRLSREMLSPTVIPQCADGPRRR